MPLQPQLERIVGELADAGRRAHEVAEPLAADAWGARPTAGEWSVAECLIHLTLTSRAFLPLIRETIRSGRDRGLVSGGPYRRDIVGRLLHWLTNPPVRLRIKTTAPFVPAAVEPKGRVLAELDSLQEQRTSCVRDADGLDLGRLRIVSPFSRRVRYNLYSCLTIIAAHQRQHLAQAGAVIRGLRAADASRPGSASRPSSPPSS